MLRYSSKPVNTASHRVITINITAQRGYIKLASDPFLVDCNNARKLISKPIRKFILSIFLFYLQSYPRTQGNLRRVSCRGDALHFPLHVSILIRISIGEVVIGRKSKITRVNCELFDVSTWIINRCSELCGYIACGVVSSSKREAFCFICGTTC